MPGMHLLLGYFARWFKKASSQDAEPALPPPPTSSPPQEFPTTESAPQPEPRRNPKAELEERCYKIGRDTALESGTRKPNTALLHSLEAGAGAIGQAAHVPPSEQRDQKRIVRLAELAEEYERHLTDRDRAAVYNAAELKKLADLGPREAPPAFPQQFYYAAVIGLSASTIPVFHDLFLGLDPFMKWVAGGICAAGLSLLIVHGIFPGSEGETNTQTTRRQL